MLVGLLLLYEVIRALFTGYTHGYYKSNVFAKSDRPGSFYFWLTLRTIIAIMMISAAWWLG